MSDDGPTPASSRVRRLPARTTLLATGAFVAVVAALTVRTARSAATGTEMGSYADFRDAVYEPARFLLEGGNPYDVDAILATGRSGAELPLYAPHHLLLYGPLGLLPIAVARVVFGGLMLAALVAVVVLGLRAAGRRPTVAAALGTAAALLLTTPGRFDFQTGQSTYPVVLGAWLALLYQGERPRLAGLGLALALLKPVFGLPVLVVLLVHRSWATLRWGIGIAVACATPVLVTLLVREGGVGALVRVWSDNAAYSASTSGMDPAESSTRVDLHALVAKVVPALNSSVVSVVLFLAVTIAVAVLSRGRMRPHPPALVTAVLAIGIVLAIVHQGYDLLFLVPAIVVLVLRAEGWRDVRARVAAVLVVVFLNPFVTRTFVESIDPDAARLALATTPTLLLVAAAIALWGRATGPTVRGGADDGHSCTPADPRLRTR